MFMLRILMNNKDLFDLVPITYCLNAHYSDPTSTIVLKISCLCKGFGKCLCKGFGEKNATTARTIFYARGLEKARMQVRK